MDVNKEFFIKGHETKEDRKGVIIACETGYSNKRNAIEFAKLYSCDNEYPYVTLHQQIFDVDGFPVKTILLKTYVDGESVSNFED